MLQCGKGGGSNPGAMGLGTGGGTLYSSVPISEPGVSTPMLDFQTWPIDRCVDYARNPRKNDHAVDGVAAAIREFGFRVPIVAKSDGTIVDGHLRLKAARKLGLTEVPVILADDMTDAQIKAFRLSVNKVAEWAEWDAGLLSLELQDLEEMGFDLSLTGFSADELSAMMGVDGTEGLTDADAVPEVPAVPVTVDGDVWLLGRHRLMCGDSTSIDAVERLMDGRKADMVLTDPPYGVSFVGVKGSMYSGGKKAGKNSAEMIKADDLRGDDLVKLFADSMSAASMSSKAGAAMYVFFAINRSQESVAGLRDAGLEIRNWLIWDKGNVGFHAMGAQYKPNYEAFLYCHKAGQSPSWYGGNKEQTVWRFPVEREGLHPTMKPVSLLCHALQNSSKSGDEVLDLFGGSGSTLIACEKHGRMARLMELDTKYCDVIITRWQDFTGQTATLESTGQAFGELKAERVAA